MLDGIVLQYSFFAWTANRVKVKLWANTNILRYVTASHMKNQTFLLKNMLWSIIRTTPLW